MAAPALVLTHANGHARSTDGIFAGLRFFLLQRLPMRASFRNKIESNGGRVVRLEAQADHVIADHYRQDCPPGSISYTFIDNALDAGALPDTADHAAGPPKGSARALASVQPTKATRTPFTPADDRELYTWVKHHEAKGGRVKGNELYKQLEARNPRHTYQAWRDRYIKKLMDNPPAGVGLEAMLSGDPEHAATTPIGTGPAPTQNGSAGFIEGSSEAQKLVVDGDEFDQEDVERLAAQGQDIESIEEDRIEEAWDAFADAWPDHSARAWRRLWEELARPRYLESLRPQQGKRRVHDTANGTNGINADEAGPLEDALTTPPSSRPQPSGSLKRKRTTPTPRKQTACGSKKQKEGHDIFSDEDSDHEQLPTRPTSSPPHTAGMATSARGQRSEFDNERQSPQTLNAVAHKSLKHAASDVSALPTSEANKAAAMQLDDDYQRLMAEKTSLASQQDDLWDGKSEGHEDEPLIISDADRAVVVPLESDYVRVGTTPVREVGKSTADALQSDGTRKVVPMSMRGENSPATRGSRPAHLDQRAGERPQRQSLERANNHQENENNVSQTEQDTFLHSAGLDSQIGDHDPSNLVQPQGDALTEANLAIQDEQQRAPLLRGTDLLKDNEMQDQSDFVHYLQTLQPAKSGLVDGVGDPVLLNPPSGATFTAEIAPIQRGSIHLSTLAQPSSKLNATAEFEDTSIFVEADTERRSPLREGTFDDLPVTAQAELDEIMEETLNWPESPKAAKTKQPLQQETTIHFETQIQYPLLPPPQQQQQGSSGNFSPKEPKKVRYPDLHDPVVQAEISPEEALQARFDREVLGVGRYEDSEGSGSGDTVQDSLQGPRIGESDLEVDLELPEPEGGVGFSSSQPGESQQQGSRAFQSLNGVMHHVVDSGLSGPHDGLDFTSPPPGHSPSTQGGSSQASEGVAGSRSHSRDGTGDGTAAHRPEHSIEIRSSSSSLSSSSSKAEAEADLGLPLKEDEGILLDYRTALETQDIYAAETQAPDLTIPFPDADWHSLSSSQDNLRDPIPTKPATQQTSPSALAETQALLSEDVDEYINRMTLAYGHTEDAVVYALKRTSLRPELAELVLLDTKAGKGLPSDVPGIWSEEEDRQVEGGNAKMLKTLEEKHGWRECEERLLWLGQYRDGDDSDEE